MGRKCPSDFLPYWLPGLRKPGAARRLTAIRHAGADLRRFLGSKRTPVRPPSQPFVGYTIPPKETRGNTTSQHPLPLTFPPPNTGRLPAGLGDCLARRGEHTESLSLDGLVPQMEVKKRVWEGHAIFVWSAGAGGGFCEEREAEVREIGVNCGCSSKKSQKKRAFPSFNPCC